MNHPHPHRWHEAASRRRRRLAARLVALLVGCCLATGAARAQADAASPADKARAAVTAAEATLAAPGTTDAEARKAQWQLVGAGNVLLSTGDVDAAVATWTRAIAVADEIGADGQGAMARGLLGDLERKRRHPAAARELLTVAAEHIGALGQPSFECFVHDALGETLMDLDQAAAAEQSYARFMEAADRAGDGALQSLAASRLAKAQAGQGRVAEARAGHTEARRLADLHPHPSYTCEVLLAAGQFHESLGEFDAARARYEQAREVLPAGNPAMGAALFGQLGLVHLAQGRFGPARTCLERVEQFCAADPLGTNSAALLGARAQMAYRLGDLYEARRLYTAILDQQLYPPFSRGETETLLSLATMSQLLDEPDQAVVFATRALEASRTAADDGRMGKAHYTLGYLAADRGDLEVAAVHYDEALQSARTRLDRSGEAVALGAMGYLRVRAGDPVGGTELALQALEIHEQLGETASSLNALHTLAAAAVQGGDASAAAGHLARAEDLFDELGAPDFDADTRAGIRSHHARFAEAAQDLTALRLSAPGLTPEARADVLAAGLAAAGRWKSRALLEGLAQAPDAASDAPAPDDDLPAALRAALGPRRALIEYVEGEQLLFAYVLDAEGLDLVPLGPRDELRAAADAYLAGIADFDHLFDAATIADRGRDLAQRLLVPLLDTLPADTAGLTFVPTPALARLPLEALVLDVAPDAGPRPTFEALTFVADRYHVTYGPSSPVLVELARRGPRSGAAPALIMGDPVYASESRGTPLADATAGALQPARFARLPGTRDEALTVARHVARSAPADTDVDLAPLTEARSGAMTTDDFTLWLGADASRERLLGEDLSRYGVIHLAAHGVVDPDDPRRSGLLLSHDGEHQGLLGMGDIAALDLDADLVVLSACDSARGPVVRGEGVQSLARAFLVAGARSVVASLWQVQDLETRSAMDAFYAQQRREGRSPAEAARRARLSLRHGETARGGALGGRAPTLAPGHPYLWAPFIWIGALPPVESRIATDAAR